MNGEKARAVCFDITPLHLAALLRLPAHACIDSVWQEGDRPGVLRMRVRGIGWPVENGAVIPKVTPTVHVERDSQGRESMWIDWHCPINQESEPHG